MSHTGENEQALQKIIDFIRLFSIVVLLFHFYYFCYPTISSWGLTFQIIDEIIKSLANTGLFNGIYPSKFFTLALLIISLVGARGRKDEKISLALAGTLLTVGVITFLLSHFLFLIKAGKLVNVFYILVTS